MIRSQPISGAIALLSVTALFTVSCFDDRVAGNGSEVENAIVLGRVTLPSGEPASGVSMQLLPEDHDARKDAAPAGSYVAVTEKDGTFRLRAQPGVFNVYASHGRLGYKLLIPGLRLAQGAVHDAGMRRMAEPGSIRMVLPGKAKAGDYVYLPGTPLSREVDPAEVSAGYLQVDSVPTGRIERVVLASASPGDSLRGLGSDVAVSPRKVTELPYTEWRHEGLVAVRTRSVAGGISQNVTGLPLLLRLDTVNFDFRQAAPDGKDLRFTRDDGKPLSWHIQAWDSLGGRASVWVRLDTVFADSTVQKVRMYWGAPDSARPVSDGSAAVFSVADGYLGAWHLDAKPKGPPAYFPDAGGKGTRMLAHGALATADSIAVGDSGANVHPAHGVLGAGLLFNGSDSHLSVADTSIAPAGFTLSFWFRTTTREGGKLAGFLMPEVDGKVGDRPGNFNFDRVAWMDNDGLLHFGFTMATPDKPGILGTWQPFVSAKAFNDGVWHQVSYTLSETAFYLYVDGLKVIGYTGPIRSLALKGLWKFGYVGEGKWDPVWTSEYFRGSLDEIRLIHAPRSEEWLRLDQIAQEPGSRLLDLERH